MSTYTQIIEHTQPVAHYNCNDISGDIVDNVNGLNFTDNSEITYQQSGALLGETNNKSILLSGTLETPNTLDTSTFGMEFACEFWIKPNTIFALGIGDNFKINLTPSNELVIISDNSWNQRGLILQASDLADSDRFGVSCSLNSTGDVMVVGANGHETAGTDTGAVYTYDRLGDSWVQRGLILQASDLADTDYFGSSCSLNSTGDVMVVGAYGHETTGNGTGAMYTYDRSGDSWVQRGLILQASDLADSDFFGSSCSLNSTGDVMVVGAYRHETTGTNTGAVYTYDRSGSTWIQRGTILQASDLAINDYFGISCSLNSTGDVMVVGAHLHETTGTDTGAVYTYDRSGSTWVQRGLILQASDITDDDNFGISCSLNSIGDVMVVGANGHETTGINTGAVYTYDRSGSTWVQRGLILQASDITDDDNFGRSCSLNSTGDVMVVGAHLHETTGNGTGAMYTYDISGNIKKSLIKGVWNHVVLNYDNQILNIYLNSYPYSTLEYSQIFQPTSELSILGNCTLDELSLYNKSLTPYEIQSHFNNAKQFDLRQNNILNTNPVGYFPMDDINDDMQSSFGNINGHYINSPTLEQTGKHNKSVLFDGIDQYAEISDPNGNTEVSLLLAFDGVNNSTNFYDDSIYNHQIEAFGDVKISTTQAKFGSSAFFDGTGDYLTTDRILDTNTWTVEAWVYQTTLSESILVEQYLLADAKRLQLKSMYSTGVISIFMGDIGAWYGTTVTTLNAWEHIAFSCDNGIVKGFLNGNLEFTSTNIGIPANLPLEVGAQNDNGPVRHFNGYMDNLIITKNVSKYSANFTPNSQPFELKPSIPISDTGDIHFNKVSLLMHMDGDDNGTVFTDSSNIGHTITNVGPVTNYSPSKFGSSAFFDGINDYLTIEHDDSLIFGVGDFTLECWVYVNTLPDGGVATDLTIFGETTTGTGDIYFHITNDLGRPTMWDGAVGYSSTVPINLGEWNHIAYTRKNSTLRIFLNGINTKEQAGYTFDNNSTTQKRIGGAVFSEVNRFFDGNIDELRITKGLARYVKNFTPQTRKHPHKIETLDWEFIKNSGDDYFDNVSLLMHMDGANNSTIFTDSSNYNHSVSKNGSTKLLTNQYRFGGSSCYFDGSGDNLVSNSSQYTFGTDDWTVEMWVRPTALNPSYARLIQIGSNNTNGTLVINRNSDVTNWNPRIEIYQSGYHAIHTNSATLPLNEWSHLAFTRFGSIYKMFVNGVLKSTVTTTLYNLTSSSLYIGSANSASTEEYKGYLDDIRITKGIARYISKFDVPTKEFPHSINQIQSNTVECWFNMKTVGVAGLNTILSKGSDVENSLVIQDEVFSTSGEIRYYYNNTTPLVITNIALGLLTWNHIAITIDETKVVVYLNGIGIGYIDDNTTVISNKSYYIASDENNVNPSNVSISDFAIHDSVLSGDEIYARYVEFENANLNQATLYYDNLRKLGLTTYYKCNETSNVFMDMIGNRHGTYYNKSLANEVNSLIPADSNNKAFYPNPNGAYISLDATLANSFYSLPTTISCQLTVKAYSSLSKHWILKGGVVFGGRFDATILGLFSSVDTNPNELYFWSISDSILHPLGFVPILNQIYNIAIVITDTTLTLYVDGIQQTVSTQTNYEIGKISQIAKDLVVSPDATEDFIIDEICVYEDNALTSDEIYELYTSSQNMAEPSEYYSYVTSLAPVHYYKMDDLTTTIKDEISGYNGLLSGTEFYLQQESLISDKTNKSILIQDTADITFDNTITLPATSTISFILTTDSSDTSDKYVIHPNWGAALYLTQSVNRLVMWNGSVSIVSDIYINESPKLVTMAINGTTTKFYLNGALVNTVNGINPNFDGLLKFANSGITSKMTFDEVMIFDRELTNLEISGIYQSSIASNTIDKYKSVDDFLHYINPSNYYPLNDITTDVIDKYGTNSGVISGIDYTQSNNALMLSDISNKSTKFTDGIITLSSSDVVDIKTLSFILKVNEFSDTNDIDILVGSTHTYASISYPHRKLVYSNGVNEQICDFTLEANKIYHITLNLVKNSVEWYINGILDSTGVINTTLTDTISAISENLGAIELDQIIVYNNRNLTSNEIYRLYNLSLYNYTQLTGYRLRGTTQIDGAYRSLNVRLYQHNTGGLLSSLVSESNGGYEFLGLQKDFEYDLVFFEDGKYTTCQEIYMGIYPDQYQY